MVRSGVHYIKPEITCLWCNAKNLRDTWTLILNSQEDLCQAHRYVRKWWTSGLYLVRNQLRLVRMSHVSTSIRKLASWRTRSLPSPSPSLPPLPYTFRKGHEPRSQWSRLGEYSRDCRRGQDEGCHVSMKLSGIFVSREVEKVVILAPWDQLMRLSNYVMPPQSGYSGDLTNNCPYSGTDPVIKSPRKR